MGNSCSKIAYTERRVKKDLFLLVISNKIIIVLTLIIIIIAIGLSDIKIFFYFFECTSFDSRNKITPVRRNYIAMND